LGLQKKKPDSASFPLQKTPSGLAKFTLTGEA
jgi:hypothetical protein